MRAIIGDMHWRDCDRCTHCHPTEGGCDAEYIDIERDYDDIVCRTFEPRETEGGAVKECEGQTRLLMEESDEQP